MHNLHAGLNHFLFISILLFALGIYAVITRKNPAMIFIGIEFILSSAILNFTAFQKFTRVSSEGQLFSIFIIIFGFLQTAAAAFIILNFYKNRRNLTTDESNKTI